MKWKKRDSSANRPPPPSYGRDVEGQENSGSFPERRRLSAEISDFPVEPQTEVTIKTRTILPKPGDARRPTACEFVTKPTKTGMNTKAVYTVPGYFDPNTGFIDEIAGGQETGEEMAYYGPNRRRSSGSIVNNLQGYLSALPRPGRASKSGSERRSSDDSGHSEAFNGHPQPPPKKPSPPQNRHNQQGNYSEEKQPNLHPNPSQATQTQKPPPPFNAQQQTNPQKHVDYGESHNFHPQQSSHQNSEQIKHLQIEFNRLAESDGNGPQSPNFAQFLRILAKALGSHPDHETTANIFRLMDTKRDGLIDFEEFSDVYKRLMDEEKKRRLSWAKVTDKTRI